MHTSGWLNSGDRVSFFGRLLYGEANGGETTLERADALGESGNEFGGTCMANLKESPSGGYSTDTINFGEAIYCLVVQCCFIRERLPGVLLRLHPHASIAQVTYGADRFVLCFLETKKDAPVYALFIGHRAIDIGGASVERGGLCVRLGETEEYPEDDKEYSMHVKVLY